MSAAACRSERTPAHQRAVGRLRVALCRRGEATALAGLHQAGCLKVRFPRGENPGWADVVTLNISGGVAAGDRLESEIAIEEAARATIAGQSAERFYRALPGAEPARVRTRITLGPGAAAEWLPQHSILFDGSALDRMLSVDLAADAWFLGVESLVFGRAAMGEEVARGRLSDVIRIRRRGRLLLHDAVRLEGPIAAHLARPAVARGARAMATLVHVAPDAEGSVERVRTALSTLAADPGPHNIVMPGRDPGIHVLPSRTKVVACPQAGLLPDPWDGRIKSGHDEAVMALDASCGRGGSPGQVEAGASAWDGMLVARILAPDGATLRAAIVAGLHALRGGRMLPRVWLC